MLDKFLRHIAQTSDAPMGLEVSKAEGPFIYTTDGRRFTDFISGIAVSSLGHRHPKVIQAIHEQVDFAELLTSNLPERLEQVYLVNSGTEATEGALKLAKKYTGRTKLIGFRNSYHGDTHGSLSV